MKKKLEQELKSIAENILSEEHSPLDELKKSARKLYENLCVLSYLEAPDIEKPVTEKAASSKSNELHRDWADKSPSESEEEDQRYAPDGTHYNPEAITEPNTEKIKDIVEQMPPESPKIHGENTHSSDFEKELRNLGVHYDNLPEFEPIEKSAARTVSQKDQEIPSKKEGHEMQNPQPPAGGSFEPKTNTSSMHTEKKSLNDRLKKGVSFGLNDRLVFIKHLFGGNSSDYDRVLSQLNTFQTFESARNFIETMVKPDYNFWKGEEVYEERFLKGVETKMS